MPNHQMSAPLSTISLFSSNNCLQDQGNFCKKRLSLVACLSLGEKLLAKEQYDEANEAFNSAHQFLATGPSLDVTSDQEFSRHNDTVSTISSPLPSSPLAHNDSYQEGECDVGPRVFDAVIVPTDVVRLDADVLRLIIAYNKALVYQASGNYCLASNIYKVITDTIRTFISSGNVDATLMHLAMRSHNNKGQIEYAKQSLKAAQAEFENALSYARQHYDNSRRVTSPIIRPSTTSTIHINSVTTPPDHQLEIASVLSNWCRTRWMLGGLDETVHTALEDVLEIRSANLCMGHVDIATAHFNFGKALLLRHSSDRALEHFLCYMRTASAYRLQLENGYLDEYGNFQDNENDSLSLDPIQGLLYILQIQNEEKNDEESQDLVWGLQTLQEKRQNLGPIHSDVASVLNYIGTLLFRRRELDYALSFFVQELRVEEHLKAKPGNDHSSKASNGVSISVTCNNIGRILQELERYSEAKYYYKRSLGDEKNALTHDCCNAQKQKCMCTKNESDDILGNDEISKIPPAAMNLYSTVWYNLGLIHDKMGAFNEAIRAFRMSLKLRRAMLGNEHSDVSCLLYNIGVLQLEQNLLDEATKSFREALAFRHTAGKGQLNDVHVIKTLQKLSSMHKAKGNLKGALVAFEDMVSVLTTTSDFDHRVRNRKMAVVLRDIADLYQAQGELQLALQHALGSVDLFRNFRISSNFDREAMDIDNSNQNERSSIEDETIALLLVGSLHHELCEPLNAQKAFSETAHLVRTNLTASVVNSTDPIQMTAVLHRLLEVSIMLSTPSCAPEA